MAAVATLDAAFAPPARRRSTGRATAWALAAPALLFFAFLFVLPLAVMLVFSVLTGNPLWRDDVTLTFDNYARMAEDAYYLEAVGQLSNSASMWRRRAW
ncbi:MAG: hypothetical protein ACFCVH_20565 [Alphaproteobacteria bacterium]